jgi:hypothetical protein
MILDDLTLPKRKRLGFGGSDDYADRLWGAHFFELSDVHELICDLAEKILQGEMNVGPLGFLPAEKTWVEWRGLAGREAFLIEAGRDNKTAVFLSAFEQADYTPEQMEEMKQRKECSGRLKIGYSIYDENQHLKLYYDGGQPSWTKKQDFSEFKQPELLSADEKIAISDWYPCQIFAALSLINSPRIIGRRQHMPHRGLERRLTQKFGLTGKFPLRAWTEIKLHVTTPKDMSSDGLHEAHLTGQKALHFCRAHLRVRLGKLEIVRGHWRGDCSLGIKQSRYKLTA